MNENTGEKDVDLGNQGLSSVAQAEAVPSHEVSEIPMAAAVLIGSSDQNTLPTIHCAQDSIISDDTATMANDIQLGNQPHLNQQSEAASTTPGAVPHNECCVDEHDSQHPHIHATPSTILHVEMDGELQQPENQAQLGREDEDASGCVTVCGRRRSCKRRAIFITISFVFAGIIVATAVSGQNSPDVPLNFSWSVQDDGLPPLSNAFPTYGSREELDNIEDCIDFCDDVADVPYLGYAYFFPDENNNNSEDESPACICYRFISCVNLGLETREGIVRSATPVPRSICDGSDRGKDRTR